MTSFALTPLRRTLMRWLYWLGPPLLLMAFIFWLGTDRASATQTRSLLERLLDRWWPDLLTRLSPDALVTANVALRKTGHFSGYALLGLLNARALRWLRGMIGPGVLFAAWTTATSWAAVDEFHQSFSRSRGASPQDVLLDSAGAALAIFLYQLCLSRKPRR
jgi:VanZ family protein